MNFGQWFFSFSKKERWGIVVLCGLCLVAFSVWLGVRFSAPTPNRWHITTYEMNKDIQHLKSTSPTSNTPSVHEINTMGVNDWMALGGLSRASCVAIVAYKNQLGGFYELSQIKEVVHIADKTFERWRRTTTCDTRKIVKLIVSPSHIATLEKHPYVGKGMAEFLVELDKTKSSQDPFEKLSKLVGQTKMLRLKTYLIFE